MNGRHYLSLSLVLLVLSGCGDDKAAADKAAADAKAAGGASSAPKTPAKGKAAGKAQATEDPIPVFSVDKNFRYEPRGRRDPFLNPEPKPVKLPPVVEPVRPEGLPGVLVEEAKVAGIISSREPGMTKVIITGPGKKTYFASRGDTLFDGTIKEIRSDEVVFTLIDPSTKRPVNPNREAIVKTGASAGKTAGEKK